MTKSIQLFIPTFRVEEVLTEIRECLEKGWTGLGFKTIEFETAWKKYTGLPHAHFVNSGTAGLHLAVRLLKEHDKWEEGDEIITTPFTFISTNHVIIYERLKPIFADIDEYLCLSPVSVQELISPRTRAVMFVGIGGNIGQLPEIAKICKKNGLRLILDASHMSGTRLNGKHCGREADATIFSFHSVKNLATADSGVICFQDPILDEDVRKWTWLGINKDTYTRSSEKGSYKWLYEVEHEGFKYHGNSIMAAIALISLKYLDQDNAYRRQIAAWYDNFFAKEKKIKTIPIPPGCESSRHLYQVMVEERDEVVLALNAQKIYPGVHYRDNTNYKMYADASGSCPNAAMASESVLSLPVHLRLSYSDVARIASSLIAIIHHQS